MSWPKLLAVSAIVKITSLSDISVLSNAAANSVVKIVLIFLGTFQWIGSQLSYSISSVFSYSIMPFFLSTGSESEEAISLLFLQIIVFLCVPFPCDLSLFSFFQHCSAPFETTFYQQITYILVLPLLSYDSKNSSKLSLIFI